jgi:hypothetical protein
VGVLAYSDSFVRGMDHDDNACVSSDFLLSVDGFPCSRSIGTSHTARSSRSRRDAISGSGTLRDDDRATVDGEFGDALIFALGHF